MCFFVGGGGGQEFIEGAARLRGNAKALDVWRMETKVEVLFEEVLNVLRGKANTDHNLDSEDRIGMVICIFVGLDVGIETKGVGSE